MSLCYYNENNPAAAAWLRELIRCGHIAPGEVDERSITEVKGSELARFKQCHFFAGIGGWSYALRLAGWADDKAVWTGSCPCQPFSQAGKRKVDADERHLWPAFRALIAECGPAIVFGEQVASADGRVWLAGVRVDLESLGYGVGAADLCAAGVSAPMCSQRLHWVAAANCHGRKARRLPVRSGRQDEAEAIAQRNGENVGRVAASGLPGRGGTEGVAAVAGGDKSQQRLLERNGVARPGLAPADRYHEHWWSGPLQMGRNCLEGEVTRGGRKYRAQWRVKPGLSLLADGIPGRVAQLCGFGNAIVPQLAAEFIAASREAIEQT